MGYVRLEIAFAAREGHLEVGTGRMLCDCTGQLCMVIAAMKHLLVCGLCEYTCRECICSQRGWERRKQLQAVVLGKPCSMKAEKGHSHCAFPIIMVYFQFHANQHQLFLEDVKQKCTQLHVAEVVEGYCPFPLELWEIFVSMVTLIQTMIMNRQYSSETTMFIVQCCAESLQHCLRPQ